MKKTLIALSILALCVPGADASTALEDNVNKAAMPHKRLGNGMPRTKVHFVRLQGHLESTEANEARLMELKRQVNSCAARMRSNGMPSKEPSAWPDYAVSLREDVYMGPNRTIRYSHGIAYALDSRDCSLLESATAQAQLVSARGVCQIDLASKTARGVCDMTGHADAPKAASSNADSERDAAQIEKLRRGRQAAALAIALRAMADQTRTGTGVMKLVLGIRCEIWNQPPQLEGGGTFCVASGGSFPASPGSHHGGQTGLILESRAPHSYNLTAVEARLDADVSASIFMPYLNAGYAISGARK